MSGGNASGLLGRSTEVAQIHAALAARRSLVVVAAAGVGKTAVIHAALATSGMAWCGGAAVDYTEALPYLPLTQVLGRRPATLDVPGVVCEVLEMLDGRMLFLDDAQWADDDTIATLEPLAASGQLITACRPGTRRSDSALAALCDLVDRVELAPLDQRAARDLARSEWPGADDATLDAVVRLAGGNPLALRVIAGGRSIALPRIHSLQAAVENLEPIPKIVLARAGLRDPSLKPTDAGVDVLERQRLVRTTNDVVTPEGDLLAELALASLCDRDRVDIHRSIAEQTCDLAFAARHWLEAGERDLAYRAAAEASQGERTCAGRAELLRIVAATAPEQVRWDAVREATEALLRLGRLDEAGRLMAENDVPDDPEIRLEAEAMRARLALEGGAHQQAIALASAALESGAPEFSRPRYWLLVNRASARGMQFDLDGACRDAEEAERIADETNESSTRARSILALIKAVSGDPNGFAMVAALLEQADRDLEPQIAFETGINLLHAAHVTSSPEVAAALGDDLRRLARVLDLPAWDVEARTAIALNQALLRPSAAVVAELDELSRHPLTGANRTKSRCFLAAVEATLGNVDRADELLDGVRAGSRIRSDEFAITWARADVAWHAGRLSDCLAIAREAADWEFTVSAGPPMLAVLGRWGALESGQDPQLVAGPLVVFRWLGGLTIESDAIALLANEEFNKAANRFLAAAEIHDHYLRVNALRCRWAAGDCLQRVGDAPQATALLQSVGAASAANGYVRLETLARSSLRALGVVEAAATANGLLSRRQVEVLDLVGAGLTSPEIATRLHLKPSTVESHIRTAMKRLGAKTRREAVTMAPRPTGS